MIELNGDLDIEDGIRDWFVVFSKHPEASPRHWWSWLTGRTWAHVWAFAIVPQDTGAVALTINPKGNHTYVHMTKLVHGFHPLDHVSKMPETLAILLVRKAPAQIRRHKMHGIYTCVSVIKDILGIHAPWKITPKGLFNHLRGMGAMLCFSKTREQQTQ